MMKKYNDKVITYIEYIFAFITVLEFNSIYMYSNQFHIIKNSLSILWQLILMILFLISLVKINDRNIDISKLFLFIITFLSISSLFYIYNLFFSMNLHLVFVVKVIIDPIMLLTMFYSFTNVKSIEHFLIILERIILIISTLSMMFWILFLCNVPTNSSDYISNWGSHQIVPGYFNIDFFTQIYTNFMGLNWVRNSSLFVEPSMFSYVLLIALLIELFVVSDKRVLNYRVLLLLITIISTASTTGILVSVPAIIYSELISLHKRHLSGIIFILLIPVIIVFLKAILSNKINASNSYAVRSDDISAGIKAWIRRPIFGWGISNNSEIRSNMSGWRFMNGSNPESTSVGFTTVLAQGGIIWGLFYLIPTLLASKISHKLMGLAVFSFIPFLFVTAQESFLYIVIMMAFWTIILRYDNKSFINGGYLIE